MVLPNSADLTVLGMYSTHGREFVLSDFQIVSVTEDLFHDYIVKGVGLSDITKHVT